MSSIEELAKHLSKVDLLDLLEVLEVARMVGDEGQFRRLLHVASRLFPVDRMNVSVAKLASDNRILATSGQIHINYPRQWLEHYQTASLAKVDPVGKILFVEEKPVVWSQLRKRSQDRGEHGFFSAAGEFGLKDGFSFGARFSRSDTGSMFTCVGSEIVKHKRHMALINFLLPYLHESFSRVHMSPSRVSALLTAREREVLNWIKFGKTDGDVAIVLGTSNRTVKFHIENAMKKLQASNRTEAVARALAQGLISWD